MQILIFLKIVHVEYEYLKKLHFLILLAISDLS